MTAVVSELFAVSFEFTVVYCYLYIGICVSLEVHNGMGYDS